MKLLSDGVSAIFLTSDWINARQVLQNSITSSSNHLPPPLKQKLRTCHFITIFPLDAWSSQSCLGPILHPFNFDSVNSISDEKLVVLLLISLVCVNQKIWEIFSVLFVNERKIISISQEAQKQKQKQKLKERKKFCFPHYKLVRATRQQ